MRSLRSTLAWWFGGSLIGLYGIAAVLIGSLAVRDGRRAFWLALNAESESVAAVVASGAVEAPEFTRLDTEPFPLWVELRDGGRRLAATPGFPQRPAGRAVPQDEGSEVWEGADGALYGSAREAVAGRPGWLVESSASYTAVLAGERRLASILALTGLLIAPLVLLGSRRVARWAASPLSNLVAEIRTFDHADSRSRLPLPARSPAELKTLVDEFNALLTRIQRTVEALHRFTADASHELRNPLAVLRTGLEVTLRRPRTAAEYEELAHGTLREIERVQATVESLLLLAREAPGESPNVERRPVDLERLADLTLASFAIPAEERGIRLTRRILPGLAALGEEALLRLLLFNLLDNALRYAPDGSEVTVEAVAEGGRAVLWVRDQGPGIAADLRDRLFERFAAGDPGARVGGLGLAFCRWVTERHGGRLLLETVPLGTCFRVELPAGSPIPTVDAEGGARSHRPADRVG